MIHRTNTELAAEYAVLEAYDRLRQVAGHDYGAGQRGAELVRRRRDYRGDIEIDAELVSASDLWQAFNRIARPRIARIESEGYRSSTKASRRTLETWSRLESRYAQGLEELEDELYVAEERELAKAADELGIELKPTSRYEEIELRKAERILKVADELGIDVEAHSIRVPAIKVGDRVEVVRGTSIEGLIGRVTMIQGGVNPSTRSRLFAYVALDEPEPGIGHFMSVPVENLERVAGEVI